LQISRMQKNPFFHFLSAFGDNYKKCLQEKTVPEGLGRLDKNFMDY